MSKSTGSKRFGNMKEIAYKHGSWSFSKTEERALDKNKLMVSLVEKMKSDIENHDPSDKSAQKIVNDLLYHYCWKMIANENN